MCDGEQHHEEEHSHHALIAHELPTFAHELQLWIGAYRLLTTFLISLFTREVRVYEVHNVGRLYDFGFVFGLTMSFGGAGRAGRRNRGKI